MGGVVGVIGIHHGLDEATYHADPCPSPSLSSGIIRALQRSPAHAHHAHPRLGGAVSESTQAQDDGAVLHALILGYDPTAWIVEAEDWRGKAAQQERASPKPRCGILATAQTALAALQEPPGSRTAEMIDEAVAWIDEQRASIRVAAEREAQDL